MESLFLTLPGKSRRRAKLLLWVPARLDENEKTVPFNVKEGDLVLMPKYGGTEVKYNETEYQIFREEEILAVID
jgi:chaperonin GroES